MRIDIAEVMKLKDNILEIPQGMASGAPRIELWGNRYALIEGYKGLLRFEKDIIELKAKSFVIAVHGFELEIKSMSRGFIEICGTVVSVDMRAGEGDV